MEYNLATTGAFWGNGIFNIPKSLVDNYIKLASEYQLKAILIILSQNGKADSALVSAALGITEKDTQNIMQFWINEGIITADESNEPAAKQTADAKSDISHVPLSNAPVYSVKDTPQIPPEPKKQKLTIAAPVLSPKDIVQAIEDNKEISELFDEAQVALGRTISHAEEEMLVNLVNFYGMKSEIILMILGYCRSKAEKGRKTSTAYILKIAENWIEEGIETIADAEEKLLAIEQSDKLWVEITALAGIKHKRPTQKQRDMITGWSRDFSFKMITLAIEEMINNAASPSLAYVDKILKNWKKAGIATPADAAKSKEEYTKSRESTAKKASKAGEITRKPTYDLEQIKKDARNNTEIKY